MNYIIAIGGLAVGILAFVLMSDVTGRSGGIDFQTASLEARQAWMDEKAESLKTAARYFLPSGRGPMSLSFRLKEIITRPESSRIEMIIDVKVPYGAEVGVVPRHQFLESFCKNYVRLDFYKQRIQLVVSFRDKKDRSPITRITVNPHDCQWHAPENS